MVITTGELVLGLLVALGCGAGIGFGVFKVLEVRKERTRNQLPTSMPRQPPPSPAASSIALSHMPRHGVPSHHAGSQPDAGVAGYRP
ncbi:hypothetical protein N656DRAFT_536619 [Canariomyces notabilis]|uniref:Uncharacterized protein n=1 Tax=Canariomyces notabilis TaxID=2074819 RepID=A0AAN6TI59_9PEZI|nr:hypothetical protein N656DRAFT_536619 [Canariomyces arenarius]